MKLDIDKWKEFKISDIFVQSRGKESAPNQNEEGDCPIISETEFNNGLVGYVKPTKIFSAPAITISINFGKVVFYQDKDFCASVNIVILQNEHLNLYNGLFITTIIRKENERYSYGYKTSKNKIDDTIIKLPVDLDGNPDWQFMEDYIKSLKYKKITTKNRKHTNCIDFSKWDSYLTSDILSIKNGIGITKEEIDENPGYLNVVQSGEENWAVLGKISRDYCVEKEYIFSDEMCLTVARSGSAGFVSFQKNGCVVGDSAKILTLKDKTHCNVYIYLFIRTVLMANKYKYTYGRKVTEDKYLNETIKLPSVNGKPDWTFMEEYIKNLPYGDRL